MKTYLMTNRILNIIKTRREEYNRNNATSYRPNFLPLVPICKICDREIEEGDNVVKIGRHKVYHESCFEESSY